MGGKSGWGEVGGAGALFVFLSLSCSSLSRAISLRRKRRMSQDHALCNVKLNDLLPVPDAQGKKIISSTALI